METHSIPSSFKERNWSRLLTEMENKNVVPIIGPELLLVNYNGTTEP